MGLGIHLCRQSGLSSVRCLAGQVGRAGGLCREQCLPSQSARTEKQLAVELGPAGPLHLTGLEINKVFKQMVLRRAGRIQRDKRVALV